MAVFISQFLSLLVSLPLKPNESNIPWMERTEHLCSAPTVLFFVFLNSSVWSVECCQRLIKRNFNHKERLFARLYNCGQRKCDTGAGCSHGWAAKPVWDSVEAGDQQRIPVGEHIQSQGTKCAPLEFVAESEDNDCKHGEICSEGNDSGKSKKKKASL